MSATFCSAASGQLERNGHPPLNLWHASELAILYYASKGSRVHFWRSTPTTASVRQKDWAFDLASEGAMK